MLKRLTTSLTKPPRLIFFMKDSWKRIIFYIILLPLILVIPSAINFAINPDMSVDQYNALATVLKSDFNLEGETIVDGVFSTTFSQTAQYDYFQIATSDTALTPYTLTFVFAEEELELYMGTMLYESRTYTELGIENYTFDLQDSTNLNSLTTAIKTLYNTQHITIIVELFATYFIALVDFFMIVLLLALIDYFIIPNQPFPFKMRYKLSVYASTIYIFSELIFILIGLNQLSFLSIIITYFYHIWIYRSVKIIPKGVNINGKNK